MSQVQPTHQGMVIIGLPLQRPLQIVGIFRAHGAPSLAPVRPSPGTHTATAMMSCEAAHEKRN